MELADALKHTVWNRNKELACCSAGMHNPRAWSGPKCVIFGPCSS